MMIQKYLDSLLNEGLEEVRFRFRQRIAEDIKNRLCSLLARWEEEDAAYFYPDILDKIKERVSEWENIPTYYAQMVCSGEREKQQYAISRYGMYERLRSSLDPQFELQEVNEDTLAQARIFMTMRPRSFISKKTRL